MRRFEDIFAPGWHAFALDEAIVGLVCDFE
jgi:hypothetical protein